MCPGAESGWGLAEDQMTIHGTRFTRRARQTKYGARWCWVTNPAVAEIIAGVLPRRATAAETRELNRRAATNPDAMSLSGVHPSYRV